MAGEKTYLGDSVYAEVEYGMLKVTTNNGWADDPRNVIFFEPETWEALLRFVEKFREAQAKMREQGGDGT